jgi:hypothetical protein
MANTVKQTKYRHLFNTDGSLRKEPCPGTLDIVAGQANGVYVRCNQCYEGYRFHFVMRLALDRD